METKEYKTLDRSNWTSGEWDNEPDKVQWPDPDTGLPCLAVRHGHFGHWCGYVGVPENHPLFKKHYEDDNPHYLQAHGGVSFSSMCSPGAEETSICHIPGPGESDQVWWFGFDCAHAQDLQPFFPEDMRIPGYPSVYRNLWYVKGQCSSLASQLKAIV